MNHHRPFTICRHDRLLAASIALCAPLAQADAVTDWNGRAIDFVVAAGLAKECLVQIAYCIGLVDPVSVMVNTHGSGALEDSALAKLVTKVFPLSPQGIIDHLDLRRPIYPKTAAYGHFGRQEFPWERLDAVDELLAKSRTV